MNWKIIFQLSFFGLIMAAGTVSLIPETIEPAFWIVIFIFCAYVIAKVCNSRYFLHGFTLSLFNSFWITAIHILFFSSYCLHHPDMSPAKMGLPAYFYTHPRLAMVLLAIPFGVIFGIIQGAFALLASKIVKKKIAA